MAIEQFIIILFIGAISGWLAGSLYKGETFGLVGNIIVGVMGSFVGSFAFHLVGLSSYGLIGSIVISTIGAIVFLATLQLLQKM